MQLAHSQVRCLPLPLPIHFHVVIPHALHPSFTVQHRAPRAMPPTHRAPPTHYARPSLDSFFFWNSGSEAVKASIKMARLFTKRQNIICMQGVSLRSRVFCSLSLP
ncbi:hypothetical protein GALMADRAFT_117921 [Galerina marginata CBS 339.88]|uniref:Uncharacterized protein n=1 Tax=Galerina marginata (strain CBS 339.88) TaxID=685588 RepID=A0A067TF08_GALM3|nr:hypothetical protein GALMADRAFT_117921 [Galerina marginata CBS 339.88]